MVTTVPERVRAALAPPSTEVPACAQCGAQIVPTRRAARQNEALCARCDQRARRAAYFRSYYETHKDRILDKNRRWARDNKDKIGRLRQARQAKQPKFGEEIRQCVDCNARVARAERCRKCYIRHRYATDPGYRARRLAITRRWLERREQTLSRSGARRRRSAAEVAATRRN